MFSERLPHIFHALFADGDLRQKLSEKERPGFEGVTGAEIGLLKAYFGKQSIAANGDGPICKIGPLDFWF